MNRELLRNELPELEAALFDGLLPSCDLYLQPTVPEFEYHRSDISPKVKFIGPLLNEVDLTYSEPDWWPELQGDRPVVHVTQGTRELDYTQLLLPTIEALANEDVLVIASTRGPPVDKIGLSNLPSKVRLEEFIPHANLLSHVDVMVTNGGYGGIQQALAHATPLVVSGTSEDKPAGWG